MKLVAFVDRADHVCCRYRVRAFAPALAAAGHSLSLHKHVRSLFAPLPPADACLIQRRLPSRWELRRLRRQYPILIFDFDDSVWLRDSHSPKGLHSARRLRRFQAVVEAADCVFAGNSFLAAQAERFAAAGSVRVVPTCLEPALYPRADHQKKIDGIRLVWIGSSSTLAGLEQVAPILDQIGQAIPGVRLKLICDRFIDLAYLPVERREWSELNEADELASADIGISWVPDDDWSRGKCGLKVLQYMAAGLPVIANPVGVHRELVRHGESGFLVNGPDDWIAAVRTLAQDPEKRHQFGRAGRSRVERDYCIARGAASWLAALGSLRPARRAA